VPYSSAVGPVILAALPPDSRDGGGALRLAWAAPRAPWQPFAELAAGTSRSGRAGAPARACLRPVAPAAARRRGRLTGGVRTL